jgi:hypothetical protein
MIENSTLRVGGNSIKVWLGDFIKSVGTILNDFGTRYSIKNKPRLVTNPSAKLINPFTLMINFTVDTNDKYQILLQGDYKQKYKDCIDGQIDLTENDQFMIINQNQQSWFKKE